VQINLRKTLFILPNLFTLSSIYCGFYAALLAASGADPEHFHRASLLIIFAMFFDMIDGRVARLTHTQSAFGVQIDSLADIVSFGVAPAVLVYHWSLWELGKLGAFVAFVYVAAGAVRLARFNVLATDVSGRPKKPGRYIVGLPIPGAAGIVVSMIAANRAVAGEVAGLHATVAVVMLSLSFCMVSTIKFRSFKDLRLNVRTACAVMIALSMAAFLTVKLHVAVAVGWLLTSYVAIGLFETLFAFSRWLRLRYSERQRRSRVGQAP